MANSLEKYDKDLMLFCAFNYNGTREPCCGFANSAVTAMSGQRRNLLIQRNHLLKDYCKEMQVVATTSNVSGQDDLYERAVAEYGPALARLSRGYEADADKRRDLLQEIHLALWRSFEGFRAECSLRTWVYRVAHNTATSWAIRSRRSRPDMLVSLEEVEQMPIAPDADRQMTVAHLMDLIRRLKAVDRQVILSYLDGMDAAEISELTGLLPGNVATRVHRIKKILAGSHQGAGDGRS